MFETVLLANRGEIAVRVIRTLRALGIRSAAVFTDADADARHVREADTAVRIESYLSAGELLRAARETGAEAVHPGYGFLAENAEFARACTAAGLVFVGPPADAIELMGDKIRAKETVRAAGVPVVPGSTGSGLSDAELAAAARKIGMPVLLKPSAGGGGKGMRLVRDEGALADEIAGARREARGSFGDDTLLVERWIDRPRHIEIQVLADGHGNVVHLAERECSLQRRHQKIVEEAPSPLLDEATRAAMGAAAVEAARSCGYAGAGTVEFIVPGGGGGPVAYYFMEMNTRLQVEHPVTELVTGLDLVEWQLRVAAGEQLTFTSADVPLKGHAVEARIYAETARVAEGGERVDFLPSAGRVRLLREPSGPGVRVDSGLLEGTEVGTAYDPMLAKVVAWGPDRDAALRRLRAALAETVVLGLDTNTGFLRRLLAHPAVASGDLDTGLVDRTGASLAAAPVPPEAYAAAALLAQSALESASRRATGPAGWTDPFADPSGWRPGGPPAWTTRWFRGAGRDPVEVRVRGLTSAAEICTGATPRTPHAATPQTPDRAFGASPGIPGGSVDAAPGAASVSAPAGGEAEGEGAQARGGAGAEPRGGSRGRSPRVSGRGGVGEHPLRAARLAHADDSSVTFELDGVTHRFSIAASPGGIWLGRDGDVWHLLDHDPVEAALRGGALVAGADALTAPMPGTVTVVKAAVGDRVAAGQSLLVVEAMKMEHVIAAPHAGTVAELDVVAGGTVAMDQVLALVVPDDGQDDGQSDGQSDGQEDPR
ncbi:acetyl/propionyl/methylcrotonyl-CoA carboxylase subunit alpha [Streptomyces sp. CMB-StM0423]|uniref:acetyl/propionyl/methylcrotonyl-CoA carboxylase subunit alpha n=1 Tax=Streptomyces sp. CMB-StM0423 TaxID=2059884 RepID=UPI000C7121E4|nr:biotin carboxylase N-terminal domain-containing protein [Streptomyces sp. CMB-StM0423]AUH42886.1 acetyl/propionyl-CoA carboxylase subunit alpha [Streptomyces sp. CMB-StM0423]